MKPAGPTAADRAEMFNAVSKATLEIANLASLLEANLSAVQGAQTALSEMATPGGSSKTATDLATQVKYAREASAAMKARSSLLAHHRLASLRTVISLPSPQRAKIDCEHLELGA